MIINIGIYHDSEKSKRVIRRDFLMSGASLSPRCIPSLLEGCSPKVPRAEAAQRQHKATEDAELHPVVRKELGAKPRPSGRQI
jgi:hypothetical protein